MIAAVLAVLLTTAPDTTFQGVPDVEATTTPVTARALGDVAVPAPAPAVPAPSHRFDGVSPIGAPMIPLAAPAHGSRGVASAASDTTARQRPVIIDYSDAYYTRLTIHKWASWAMLPLFGLAYYTGQDLYNNGLDAPQWERNIHGPVAASLAGLFTVNTVTGVWNLWEGRKDPNGRAWRTTHGVLMLLADAGFAAVGMTAPEHEEASGVFNPGSSLGESGGNQSLHRGLAIGSMAVAVVSWVMMMPPFRRD